LIDGGATSDQTKVPGGAVLEERRDSLAFGQIPVAIDSQVVLDDEDRRIDLGNVVVWQVIESVVVYQGGRMLPLAPGL